MPVGLQKAYENTILSTNNFLKISQFLEKGITWPQDKSLNRKKNNRIQYRNTGVRKIYYTGAEQ